MFYLFSDREPKKRLVSYYLDCANDAANRKIYIQGTEYLASVLMSFEEERHAENVESFTYKSARMPQAVTLSHVRATKDFSFFF